MVTATKSSADILSVSNNTNASTKSTTKYEISDSKDFKDVLSSKANTKDSDDNRVDNSYKDTQVEDKDTTQVEEKDTTQADEVKDDLKDLEEDSKSGSKDEVNDILAELMNLLNKLGISTDDIKCNGEVNSDSLKAIIQEINGEANSGDSVSSNLEKLLQLLQTDSAKESLDTDSLKSIENILKNVSASLADDNTESAKDIKNGIKDLTSQISNMLDNKQNQNGKVLTLEDMLNKNYSQENKESSSESGSNNATSSKDTKEVSKEDKFLNSLLDDSTDSATDKINLFASRTQVAQNQGVNNVNNELTVNKATFTNDLIQDVKYMSNNGIKELTVKINPGNLGEITIKLVEDDGVMKANLKANSKETAALLAQNLADIKSQLSEQNIKIADVNIELYQEDTTFFSGEGFESQLSEEQQKNSNTSSNKTGEINTEDNLIEDIQIVDNGNVNFLA